MSIIEGLRKAKDDAAAAKSPRESGRRLDEILQDQRDGRLFGDHISKLAGGEDLAQRLRSNTLSAGDLDTLALHQASFNEQMNTSKKIVENLTPDMAEALGERQPEFKKLLGLAGKEKMSQLWKDQLYDLAINNPTTFANLKTKFEGYIKLRERADENIKKTCTRYGITPETFQNVMMNQNKSERRQLLRQEISTSYGLIGQFFNNVTLGMLARANAIDVDLQDRANVEKDLAALDREMLKVGKVLQGTVDANPEIRDAFARHILSERKKENSDLSFRESGRFTPREEDIISKWNETRPVNFGTLSSGDQDLQRTQFLASLRRGYETQLAPQQGFWAQVIGALFGISFDHFDKNKLK